MKKDSKNYTIKPGEVLIGSALLKSKKYQAKNHADYMCRNMKFNKAYFYKQKKSKSENYKILEKLKKDFRIYREQWSQQAKDSIKNKIVGKKLEKESINPLCIDIEVAAICDLACPFCYREHIVTPDKIIDEKFCYNLIDQAAEMKVPSIKFNWRGEPLLHPKLPQFINYAKKKGILETIINTNATNLNEKKSKELINAGLDLMIYSFDGGSKKTYESMRPGRFKKNKFENVYQNIKRFKKIKDKMSAQLPYTKIQMILTKDTMNEVDSFFKLFENYVDDISLNQYTERGGNLDELNDSELNNYKKKIKEKKLPYNTPYLRDIFRNIKVAQKRLPCDQPYQRLMVTYEGKVAMCCQDWGAKHAVGYTSPVGFNNKKDYLNVLNKAKRKDKGFELLEKVEMPKIFNSPEKKVETLKDIWFGKEINEVRNSHLKCNGMNIDICKNCTVKDVYQWE